MDPNINIVTRYQCVFAIGSKVGAMLRGGIVQYGIITSCLSKYYSINSWICYEGGEDFDQRVMDHFIKLYKKKKGKDIRSSNRAVQKLRREVEKAKRALSSQHQARIEIESFFEGEDFSETLTRAKFEELNMVSASEEYFDGGQCKIFDCLVAWIFHWCEKSFGFQPSGLDITNI